MFSKAKNKNNKAQDVTSELVEIGDVAEKAPGRTSQSKSQAKTSSRMTSGGNRKPVTRSSGVPSLISGDVIIKGTIEAEGEVQFDGFLEGDIRAKGLVIGEGASVKGEVVAQKVKVSGTIEGAIRAGHVELASSAHVKGDILHSALSIENGARFDGNCRHSDDPMTDSASRAKPAVAKQAPRTVTNAVVEPEMVAEEKSVELEAVLADGSNDAGDAKPVLKTVKASQGSSFLSRGGKSDLR